MCIAGIESSFIFSLSDIDLSHPERLRINKLHTSKRKS